MAIFFTFTVFSLIEKCLRYSKKCDIFSRPTRQLTCSTGNDGKHRGTHNQTWALDRVILKPTSNFSETFEFPFYGYSLHGTFKNFSVNFLHKKFEFSSLFVLGSRSRSQSRPYYLDRSSVPRSSRRDLSSHGYIGIR